MMMIESGLECGKSEDFSDQALSVDEYPVGWGRSVLSKNNALN
jgi:hypothetical protein